MRVKIILSFLLLFSVLMAPCAYAYWVERLESQWTIPVTYEVNITVTGGEAENEIVPNDVELREDESLTVSSGSDTGIDSMDNASSSDGSGSDSGSSSGDSDGSGSDSGGGSGGSDGGGE